MSTKHVETNVEMANKEETLNVDSDHLSIENSIDILNDDVMLNIFSYLDFDELLQVAQVCVRWRAIVVQMFAYQDKLKFDQFFSLAITDFPINSVVSVIKGCGPRLQELTLTGFGTGVNDVIQAFAPSCPNLVKIDLSKSHIGRNGITALAYYCKTLQEIKLNGYFNAMSGLPVFDLTDDCLEYMMRSIPTLKKLEIPASFRLNGKCLRQLGPQIEKLTLNDKNLISPVIISKFLRHGVKTLKELCLVGDVALRKQSFNIFCKSCVNIKKLEISSSKSGNDIFCELSNMTWLEELNLSNDVKLNDYAIARICRGCRNLRVLNISHSGKDISDYSVSLVAENCLQLVELDISGIIKISTRTLRKFAEVGILKRLIAYDTKLGNSGVFELVTRCPRLELMDISGCLEVDNSILQPCINAVHSRVDKLPLKLIVGDTEIMESDVSKDPLLILDFDSNSCGCLRFVDCDYWDDWQIGRGDYDDWTNQSD